MSSPGLELTSTDSLTNCIFTHDPRILRFGKTTNIYEGQNREFGQWGGPDVRWGLCRRRIYERVQYIRSLRFGQYGDPRYL